MYPFTYHRPATLPDAVTLLRDGAEPKLVAGGMSLLPTLKQRLASPSALIDLSGLRELQDVRFTPGTVRIGAMVRHAAVAASAEIRARVPVLAQLAGGIGDVQVRNRGTIGGSIANNDPAADYPAAVLGLGATVETSTRKIAGDDFFLGLFETALEGDEVITGVTFPIPDAACYLKFKQAASRFALVGVMVARFGSTVRVAVTGAGPCVFRVGAFEQALQARFAPEALDGLTLPADGLNTDIHADAEYRAHLVGVQTRRAVAAILSGAA
jgi:carbon-monoxide dehydrogenase medium subunit